MAKKRIIQYDKWYLVDLSKKAVRLGYYPLFKVSFKNKKRAVAALMRNFNKDERILVKVIKGADAIDYGLGFKEASNWYKRIIYKYDYPPDKLTPKERKVFRTKYRRWLRTTKKELDNIWA